jgi:hypothetical protein
MGLLPTEVDSSTASEETAAFFEENRLLGGIFAI